MAVTVTPLSIPDVLLIEPDVFVDDRGYFLETYHAERYAQAGADRVFVQDNHSRSRQGVVRGLHYQLKNAQSKLIYAVHGEIFDVAVDIRRGSPHFGKWTGTILSDQNKRQLFIPEGFAHGFSVLSERADVIYKCSALYAPDDEYGIHWADPAIGIRWGIDQPVVSEKDDRNPMLDRAAPEHLPIFKA